MAKICGLPTQPPLVDAKLLSAAFGQGEQLVHWDSKLGAELGSTRKTSFILYATDTDTTAMPRFTTEYSLSTAGMRKNKRRKVIELGFGDKVNYHSVPVSAGATLVFKQCVPHYGVQNTRRKDRVLLFDMRSKSSRIDQDDWVHQIAHYKTECDYPHSD